MSAINELKEPKLEYPIDFTNKIVCGDALAIMKQLPSNAIDLVVTSPPYNLKNSSGNGMKDGRGGKWANAALQKGYSHHSDCMPHEEYVAWQRSCLHEMLRLIPETGAIFYNHKWRVQNGLLQDRNDILAGFPVRQIIIWRRKGGFNFNPGYFLPTYEVIYLIAKPKFKLIPKANAYGDVWEFTQELNNEHPAAFPVDLIERIISSTNAKLVLDPFMGSGTTAIAASNLNRNYIGIDISPDYCKMAGKRLKKAPHNYFLQMSSLLTYTKDELIQRLKEIVNSGWIESVRHGNHGGIGNTLEHLLGIKENNLPISNSVEWELKAQRLSSSSLTTLFHMEPSPRALRFVPQIFLLNYGWPHQKAGIRHPHDEMSFRQTIHTKSPSDRGFQVIVDRPSKKVLISFDSRKVDPRHAEWLKTVKKRTGTSELISQPYWGFDDLAPKAGVKLRNCFFVQAHVKKEGKKDFYSFQKIMKLEKFNFNGFLTALEESKVLIDFDARTQHNHGTKFRLRQDCLPMLYEKATVII